MTEDPASELVRWVKDGERLFRLTIESLHGAAAAQSRLEALAQETAHLRRENEALAQETAHLRRENEALRRELEVLRAERLEVADTFKAFAEHVTRLATLALQRLGTPGLLNEEGPTGRQAPRAP